MNKDKKFVFVKEPTDQKKQAQKIQSNKETSINSNPNSLEEFSILQQQLSLSKNNEDAEICAECGSVMIRNGSCYKCPSCGATSGCS